jgi:hypothetical protein
MRLPRASPRDVEVGVGNGVSSQWTMTIVTIAVLASTHDGGSRAGFLTPDWVKPSTSTLELVSSSHMSDDLRAA